jgi:hypothetical protein
MTRTLAPPVGPASQPEPVAPKSRFLLACGAIAGPLFVAATLLEGATRAGYSQLRHPVSSLALGPLGWTQVANFIVTGLLTTAFAVGMRRALRPGKGSVRGPLLVGIWGVQLVLAGIFVTDPVSGYPPGTPAQVVTPTLHGAVHDLVAVPGFAALAAAFFVLTRRFAALGRRGWVVYSVLSGLVFLAAFFLAGAGFGQAQTLVEFGGLFQRVAVFTGWTWLTLLAVHLLRDRPTPAGRGGRST